MVRLADDDGDNGHGDSRSVHVVLVRETVRLRVVSR